MIDNLAVTLDWKYPGHGASTSVHKNGTFEVHGWNHPTIQQPSNNQLLLDIAEYEAANPAWKKRREDEYRKRLDNLIIIALGQSRDTGVIDWTAVDAERALIKSEITKI